MARHAERYPTKRAGNAQKAVVSRMKRSGKVFTGNLAFFNNWELFWSSGRFPSPESDSIAQLPLSLDPFLFCGQDGST